MGCWVPCGLKPGQPPGAIEHRIAWFLALNSPLAHPPPTTRARVSACPSVVPKLSVAMQLVDYLPIAVMFVLAVGFVAVSLVVSRLVSPEQPDARRSSPPTSAASFPKSNRFSASRSSSIW